MSVARLFRRPEQRWVFFVLACLSVLMFAIDTTIIAVALRPMVDDLDTSLSLAGWTITAFALVQTVMLPLAGKLAEQFGAMRVFLVCVVVFTVGSLLCGLAPNVYVLIACRVLQALGGGGFMPSATGIVATLFPEQRGKLLGLFASIWPIGGIIGPNLGGFIVQHYSWRDIFLVNVPIGIVVALILIPQARQGGTGAARKIDFLGTALFAGSIVCVLLALTQLGEDPSLIASPQFWLTLAGGLALMGIFIWHERRFPEPILDLGMVSRHPFLVVNIYSFLFGVCVFGCFSFIPYFASVQYGMSALESGAVLTPRSLASIVVSLFTSLFIMRLGYRVPMTIGLILLVAVLLAMAQGMEQLSLGPLELDSFVLLALIVGVSGIGMGLVMPTSMNAGLDLMPERAATITGVRGLFRTAGAVIGTAIIVLALDLSADKAAGMRAVFLVLGIVLLLTIPLVFLIPDRARAPRDGAAGGARTRPAEAR